MLIGGAAIATLTIYSWLYYTVRPLLRISWPTYLSFFLLGVMSFSPYFNKKSSEVLCCILFAHVFESLDLHIYLFFSAGRHVVFSIFQQKNLWRSFAELVFNTTHNTVQLHFNRVNPLDTIKRGNLASILIMHQRYCSYVSMKKFLRSRLQINWHNKN